MAKSPAQLDALRRAYGDHRSEARPGEKVEVNFRLNLSPEEKRRNDRALEQAASRASQLAQRD